MSLPILTKPVLFFKSGQGGDYLFQEQLLRPELFDQMFTWGNPTFPAIPSAQTHAAWPPSTALAIIPEGTVFPVISNGQADPVNTWTAPADLHLFKVSTDTWDSEDTWSVGTAKAKQRRLTYRTTVQPPSAIPTNDGWYGYDYADQSKYAPLAAVPWNSYLTGFAPSPTVRFQGWEMFAQQYTHYRVNPVLPPLYDCTATNGWLCLLDGAALYDSQYPELGDLNLMSNGQGRLYDMAYLLGEKPIFVKILDATPVPTRLQNVSGNGWFNYYWEVYAWQGGVPFDGFITDPPKRPMANLTTTIGALLLLGVGMLTNGNPPARPRKRRNQAA
jgi:hypothetical protein